MLVTVIIPSFRQPQFLGRAIESCLEQDHEDLEIIVVEDRSRDASLAIALSYAQTDSRVRVVECGENGGLGKARNVGLTHATGDYLCFLDSDDYLLDRSISARIAALDEAIATHGDRVVGVYGDWQHVAEAVDYPKVKQARSSMPLVSAETYTGENVFICSAPLVRRDSVMDAGGFPEGLRMLEDFSLWAKMIAGGAIFAPVHHVVATYRQRPNSMLRGDGVVVMADHASVINEWVERSDVLLADAGAMTAWLANEVPFSFGRMSWNVPSVLGSFGGAADAGAIQAKHGEVTELATSIDDFMSNSITTGLDEPSPIWDGHASPTPQLAIAVSSFEQSIQAVGVVEQAWTDPADVAVFAEDPTDWATLWPLALAGFSVRPVSELAGLVNETTSVVDLSQPTGPFTDTDALFASGLAAIWPTSPDPDADGNDGVNGNDNTTDNDGSSSPARRSYSLVYVPDALSGYPALDAWISTALHALADAGLDPRIVTDPAMRGELGGYRSELFSVEAFLSAAVVIAPTGDHHWLVEQLAPTVTFDPSVEGNHARTAPDLRQNLVS